MSLIPQGYGTTREHRISILLSCAIPNLFPSRISSTGWPVLMPVLLIFLASEYINENIYGNTVTIEQDGLISGVNPYQMLLMQALGAVSLFCIMFSLHSFQKQWGTTYKIRS